MFYLLAQAETANQEHVVNHLLNVVQNVLTNPVAITMVFAMGTAIVAGLMKHRYDLRQGGDRCDAEAGDDSARHVGRGDRAGADGEER